MRSQYFCAYHSEKMKSCESEAIRQWSQLMQRGVKAYSECRIDAAQIYLGSAFDIAHLRSDCEKNGVFSEMHLLKPVEFLLQIYLMTDLFDEAYQVLHRISAVSDKNKDFFTHGAEVFLGDNYERLEVAEKTFFGSAKDHKASLLDSFPLSAVH